MRLLVNVGIFPLWFPEQECDPGSMLAKGQQYRAIISMDNTWINPFIKAKAVLTHSDNSEEVLFDWKKFPKIGRQIYADRSTNAGAITGSETIRVTLKRFVVGVTAISCRVHVI